MKDEKGASRDIRRLETRFAQLQSQLEGVAAENRDLRDQIAVLTEHLGAVKRGETETALPLELSPPAPPESLPRRVGEGFLFRDIYGDERFVSFSDLEPLPDGGGRPYEIRAMHFIPGELLLGKAMLVFWPVFPHLRWKLLR